MKTTNDMTKEIKSLCKCLFSAPANIKPGYRKFLVRSYFDPLTTSKPEEEEDIVCSDITQISKKNINYFSYNTATNIQVEVSLLQISYQNPINHFL